MPLQVIDINHWNVERRGQSFGKGKTHEQRAHKSRTAGKGNGVEILHFDSCSPNGFAHYRNDILLMCTTGKFGNYAAKCFVNSLACDDIAEHYAVAKHGSRSVITR